MGKILSPTGKPITLRPIHANVGRQAMYQRRLDRLVREMQDSLVYWITAAYREKPPELAQDAAPTDGLYTGRSPAMVMRELMRRLTTKWQRRFNDAALDLARSFTEDAYVQTDSAYRAAMKKAGMTVKFVMTPEMNDAIQATIGEQVGLIKSIASEHLAEVQGLVMRSITTGRDLEYLHKELTARYGITKRRASLIARDQNNKATATITRVRTQELGLTEAEWMHSHGGKHPRPSHLRADGKRYQIAQGMYLDGKWTWPGVEINCRCVSRPVIPGF
jgi:SPP1 gp7 family putative phage head morphogenesis protein